jgi:hypothetical protein
MQPEAAAPAESDRKPEPAAEAPPEEAPRPPEQEKEPQPEPRPEPAPDVIPPPPAPAEKPRYALPLVAAGLVGALFGAVGGAVVPALLGSAPPPPAPALDMQRLQRIEQGLAALQSRPAAASPAPAAPAAPGVTAEEGARLAQRLAAVEADVTRRLAEQEQRIAAIPAPAAPAAPAPTVDLAPLSGRIDAAERLLAELDRKAEAARAAAVEAAKAAEPKIAEMTAALARTAQRVETVAAAPLFGAAQTLGQAFERGRPFPGELSALEALGVANDRLQALRALAEKGAPTAQAIADAFRPLAMQAARAGQPAATGAQALLESLVRTRAAGPGASGAPDGVVAQIEAALARGDVAGALALWDKLPEAARKATDGWAALARGREAARQAIQAIEEQALAALRKPAP